jgi:hypothetical protein
MPVNRGFGAYLRLLLASARQHHLPFLVWARVWAEPLVDIWLS